MPPGTPHHNGVSERHNHTLLDIVQSMMSLTDLPLSFWGYALETMIRPFCIMLLYRYLLHYGLLLHIMSQYLCLFSLILQG